jgi:hypothetical protein
MLMTFARKLCPLLTLAVATMSCGKKIQDQNATPSRQTQNQTIPSTYIIELDGAEASRKNYFMPQYGQFEIPDRLKVRSGLTINKVVEIAYEVNKYENDDFQFKCIYVASANPSEMILSDCVDYDGDSFGDVSGHIFGLRKDDIIQMRFTGASAQDLVVEVFYSINWK